MNLILFTGQSGIMAKGCLKRLSEQIGSTVEIISVEEIMANISNRSFRQEILLEKLSYQYELWKEAFEKVLVELESFNPNKTIFLTLHGVYYHQDKCEFVSPIDIELMTKLKGRVKMLIVLINDIYDVYRLLMADGEMYSFVKKLTPFEALYTSIFNLISILEWRQNEIALSRLIARILDIPMYIVATKHDKSMIAKLINIPIENLQIFYLSHPISSVRKDAIQQLPNFVGELNSFARTVMNLPNAILFLPGTIDELIIKKENDIYLPEFLPRWPLPYDKECWVSPSLPIELENINPLNPLNYDIASSSEIKMSVSYLLKLLCDHINVQITSRDLSLVEQSKNGVIAYRPYFPHKLSGGVFRELEHNYRIYKKEGSRRGVILSVSTDQGKARIQHFFTLIETLVQNLDETIKQKLQDESYKWISNPERVNLFSNDIALRGKLTDIRREVEKILPPDYNFQTGFLSDDASLQSGKMAEQERQRMKGFELIVNTVLKDPLDEYLISTEDYHKFHSSNEIKVDVI